MSKLSAVPTLLLPRRKVETQTFRLKGKVETVVRVNEPKEELINAQQLLEFLSHDSCQCLVELAYCSARVQFSDEA